jgi:hypothetical protein
MFEKNAQFARDGSQTAFSVLYPDGRLLWDEGTSKTVESIIFDNKQVGKKWGEHMKDYPQFKSYNDYKNYANDIFTNYDKKIFDTVNNEWYYIKGDDLLRLKPDGTFISLYPGANSPRVTNVK